MDLVLTPTHLCILRASLGLADSGHGQEWRNCYQAGPSHHAYHLVQELVQAGYMVKCMPHGFQGRGDNHFHVTKQGREVAVVPEPVLSRPKHR